MNKIYIVNGEKFNVHEANEQQFLTKFPDAQLFEGPLTEEESEELGKEESILPSASVEETQALDMGFRSGDGFLASLKDEKPIDGSDFLTGLKKTSIQMKQAFEGSVFLGAQENLQNLNEKIEKLGLSSDDEVTYGEIFNPRTNTYSGGKRATVKEAKKELANNVIEPLLKTQEYQEVLKRFKSPEALDGLTLDEYQQMLGEQGMQMAGAIVTGGMSTYFQESSNAALEIARNLAIDKAGISEEEFNSYTPDKKAALMYDVVESGEADFNSAITAGAINAGVDLASNFFVVGKAAKVVPKDFFRALVKGRVKKILNNAKTTAVVTGVSTGVEVGTELTQEAVSDVAVAVGSDRDIEINPREYAEVAIQTLITTPGIQAGVKTTTTSVDQVRTLVNADRRQANQISSALKDAVDQKVKNGDISQEKADTMYNNINAAEEVINNTNYSKFDKAGKELAFDNLIKRQDVQKRN